MDSANQSVKLHFSHAEDWGQPWSPEVNVLAQEQSPSPLIGSMLRHPHLLGQIDINYIDRNEREIFYRKNTRLNFNYARLYPNGSLFHIGDGLVSDDEIRALVNLYRSVEKSGIVDESYVYQMEFGFRPLAIYQLRPFRKKEEARDFFIPYSSQLTVPNIDSLFVFGITSPEGVMLTWKATEFLNLERGHFDVPQKPYGLIVTDKIKNSLPAAVTSGDLIGVITQASSVDYLEHGVYGLLKKARYGLCEVDSHNLPRSRFGVFDFNEMKQFQRARLWSNGERALIIPEEYAQKL